MRLDVTVSETIGVPDGCEIETAATGNGAGFRLPDGRLIRAWIVYEIEEEDGSERELLDDDLNALGLTVGEDYDRIIEEA